jgi:hypothetical protein
MSYPRLDLRVNRVKLSTMMTLGVSRPDRAEGHRTPLARARALSAPDAGAARVDREPDCDRAIQREAGQEGTRKRHTYRRECAAGVSLKNRGVPAGSGSATFAVLQLNSLGLPTEARSGAASEGWRGRRDSNPRPPE